MNLDGMYKKLIAVARTAAPSDCVPYAFEKRILALLTTRPVADLWTLWSRALWYAAASCVAIMLLLGTVWFFASQGNGSSVDLSQHFENTLLGAVQAEDSW